MADLIVSAAEVIAEMEADQAEIATVPVDLRDASQPGGALALMVALATARARADVQVALDGISADTATGDRLRAIAARALVTPRPATSSRYTVRAVDGPATWEGGETVRGGGADGSALWTVVTTGTVDAGGNLVIEAVDTGPITLPAPTTTLDVVEAVPGTTQLVWDDSTDPAGQIGRDAETDGELRARLEAPGALRSALLDETTWVRSVSVTPPSSGPTAGRREVTVAPGPVGADQVAELVQIIGERALGIELSGDESADWDAPGGDTVSIAYSVAATEDVAVIVKVEGDNADESAIVAAVLAYGGTLTAESNVVRLARISQRVMAVRDVVDVATITIDGSAANYAPAPGVVPLLSVSVVYL